MSLSVSLTKVQPTCVFDYNITHNMNRMADAAGIYQALWRPEELGFEFAWQLIAPLEQGLAYLLANQEELEKLNPPNGWGTYGGLVQFVEEYLTACRKHPTAIISVSR